MSVRTPEVVSSQPKSDLSANHTRKWALWFGGIAVAVWLFYVFVVPNLGTGPQTFIREWMPLGSINEALVWVMVRAFARGAIERCPWFGARD